MQRWFFLEDPSNAEIRKGKGEAKTSSTSLKSTEYTPKKWLFRVRVPYASLRNDEVVCVCGDLPEMGSWQAEKCVPLMREDDTDVWSATVEIPEKKKVEFRYAICIILELGIQVIVRSWETNLQPRAVDSISGNSPTIEDPPHEYGCYNDKALVDRGWLSKETVIQLKLCNNPLVLFRPKYQNRNVYIKVTPVSLTRYNSGFPKTLSEALDESLSADTQDSIEAPSHAFTEVASLHAEDPSFYPQNQFGHVFLKDDMLIFQSTVLFPANIAFLIDLYIYSSKCGEGEPPYHAGFSYLLPSVFQTSEGHVVLPMTSTKHRPLGQIRIEYVIIGPLPNFKCDMLVSYARHWNKNRSGLDVGHRGSGSSFKTKVQNCAEVRENTIASLKNAIEHGADYVEFDVQLSKDLVPIIYHDFHVCISMKRKKELIESDMLEIPLKELTLEQLKLLKVCWLSKETVIQLKLCNNPLVLFRPKYQNRNVYIKVTPVSLTRYNSGFPKTLSEALDESLSADTQDSIEAPSHAFTEVASLHAEDPSFYPQNQFGHVFLKDDMLIFQSTVLFPANIAFLIDLYIYSSKCGEGEPPYHAGFSYLLPSVFQTSEGHVVLPMTSTKHRPLGQIRIEYVIIGPLPNFKCDMLVSYARHWNKNRSGLDVGHRGSGSSFKTKVQNCAEVRENTIASLKNAIEHGADYVEFDVQLSKDLVPIIYHDFHVCISMKRKKELIESDMLEIPLKELTLEQLKLLKVYHLTEGKSKNPRFFDEELDDHQPFPTLQQALETLDSHTGFNIEIKWTMQSFDGTYELYHPTDLNLYLDTILDVVLRYGGDRRIIFSCFNPDICQVIRLKQNKYPVMFLTIGESQIYSKYMDPRCWSIRSAAQYARMIEILGINVHTEDLLKDASLIKHGTEAGLVVFCWGDDNADPATIKYLKDLGLHGVIYDKIHEYKSKEAKESIFMVEAKDSQKELIRLAAAVSETPQSPPPQAVIKEPVLDFQSVKGQLGDVMSTATSLESLESRISEQDQIKVTV